MDDQVEEAVEIGRANAHLISLGKAWCTHIRADRSGWGVGMIEEITGLPVTGGRFTCNFARRPVGFAGMRLEATALNFYEDNCKGCADRAPGNRVPNLSTWAEPLLTERTEREQAREAARQAELAERQQRADHRTLIAASLPATSQEIVALINRIDLEASDTEAQESIGNLARLAPDAFSDDIKTMLYNAARMLRSAVLLDVLLSVERPGGSQLHELCLKAVREGWGRAEGCRYLGEHGLRSDLDQDLLDAVIFHAAPPVQLMFHTPGEPAALLRYHSRASDTVEQRIRTLLGHGQAIRRAAAAAAAQAIVAADPTGGERLLTALLDGLRHEEDIHDQIRASGEIASVVAMILRHAPNVVDAAVERRWRGASSGYRSRLIDCFDSVVRRRSEQIPNEVGRIVVTRAVIALSEPLDRPLGGHGDDYQIRASDLLKRAVRASPTEALPPNVIIALLLDWLDRDANLAEPDPTDPVAPLQQMATRATIGRIIRDIRDSVVELGQRDPATFTAIGADICASTETAPSVRAEAVQVVGRVAAASGAINDALPLIYTAMLGGDQVVRAAGVEAAETLMRAIPQESIPPLLAQAAVAGLADRFLIVVRAAIKAARRVPADLINHREATVQLLDRARAYATDRLHNQLVRDAFAAVHHLVGDDERWLPPTRAAVLEIVKLMPAYDARETLLRHGWLEPHDNWPDAAIHALRLDDTLGLEHLGDSDTETLLEKLGRRRLVTGQIDTLAAGELEVSKFDWRRSLLAAELFSEIGRPDLSVRMIGAHLESVPNTIEQQATRRAMEQVRLVYGFEEAVLLRSHDTRREVLQQVEALCADQ